MYCVGKYYIRILSLRLYSKSAFDIPGLHAEIDHFIELCILLGDALSNVEGINPRLRQGYHYRRCGQGRVSNHEYVRGLD